MYISVKKSITYKMVHMVTDFLFCSILIAHLYIFGYLEGNRRKIEPIKGTYVHYSK